jgi:hypothetical protein
MASCVTWSATVTDTHSTNHCIISVRVSANAAVEACRACGRLPVVSKLNIDSQKRETEEKASQLETKPGAIAQTCHTARPVEYLITEPQP